MTSSRSQHQSWSGQRFAFVPALDGIRACAVLGVFALHGGAHVNGGFIGVDLFFVLSGFLITTLLLQEWQDRGEIRLGAFYLRRARRLLPALALTLVAVGLLTAIVSSYYQGGVEFPAALLSVVLYAANWVDAFVSGHQGGLGPLTHAWSLSIEEQFYLLWPGILLVCLRRRVASRHLLLGLCVVALLSSIERGLLWGYHVGGDPYYRTDTHADGIVLGCALAVGRAWSVTAPLVARALRSTALAVIACGTLFCLALALDLNSGFLFLGGYALVCLASVVLVGHAVTAQKSLVSQLLALRALRWIGERSYGIYLYHIPIIFLLTKERMGTVRPVAFAIQLAVTLAVAALSYRFVELRFLKKRRATEPQTTRSGNVSAPSAGKLARSSVGD